MPPEPSTTLTIASVSLYRSHTYLYALQPHRGPIAEVVSMAVQVQHHQESCTDVSLSGLKQYLPLWVFESPLEILCVQQCWPASPVYRHV